MQTQEIGQAQVNELFNQYEKIDNWKKIGPFCVDGRDGPCTMADGKQESKHLFVQALGGSVLIAVLAYLRSDRSEPFNAFATSAINQLRSAGYGAGVHRGSHRTHEASDCGFCDKSAEIVSVAFLRQTCCDNSCPTLLGDAPEVTWTKVPRFEWVGALD